MKKYYLEVEVRYTLYTLIHEEENEYDKDHENVKVHSDLFDTEKECIDYGNQIITNNLWMEQYPGDVGSRLERRYGYPLVFNTLKNGTQIILAVRSLEITESQGIEDLLRKFDLTGRITKKIV